MAIDLGKISGLPIKLNGSKLAFGSGMKKIEPEARTYKRMLAVLKNPATEAPAEFYYMYRDVALEKDRKKIEQNKLRFDITVLPPFKVGDEFNKTFGHYHPKALGTETWYPEIYEILHGHAHYLLQNGEEFLVFDARPGDKCVMLPGFAHVTVNPSSKDTLVMANWVYPGFESDYKPIERLKGVEWYETIHGFVQNKMYSKHHRINLISPKSFPQFGFENAKPMYKSAMREPKKFEWLSKPQDYSKQFEAYRKA